MTRHFAEVVRNLFLSVNLSTWTVNSGTKGLIYKQTTSTHYTTRGPEFTPKAESYYIYEFDKEQFIVHRGLESKGPGLIYMAFSRSGFNLDSIIHKGANTQQAISAYDNPVQCRRADDKAPKYEQESEPRKITKIKREPKLISICPSL